LQLSKVQEEPLAQSVEQQPFKLWVAGSNPARLTKGPHRLEAQDTALSRRKHEFESHWGRQIFVTTEKQANKTVSGKPRDFVLR
jgi:hypothetical protein